MAAEEEAAARAKPSGTDVAQGFCEAFLTEDFFRTHWEQKPLHHRAREHGRIANRLPEALLPDDVMAMYHTAGPSLKMFKSGEPSELNDFMAGYIDGVSLIINQADRTSPVLMDLCRALAKVHFMHTFCVAYLTPPKSQAVRLHTDDQDVFLMQVWGKKQWTIRNAPKLLCYSEEMLGKDVPVPPELIGDPIMEFTIEAGDILYLPRGYLHEAATGEEHSLHITVTMPTSDYCWGVQLVRDCMRHLKVADDPASVMNRYLYSKAPCEDDEKEVDKLLQDAVGSWASSLKIDGVLKAFETSMEKTNEGQERQFAQIQRTRGPPFVTEDSKIRLIHGITCLCHPKKDLALFVRDVENQQMELPVARSVMPMLKALTHRPQLVAALPCNDAFERLCVLQLLLQQGVLQLFVGKNCLEHSSPDG